MTNFIFKSQTTFKKISNQLELILAEQRCQRADLQHIKTMLQFLKNDHKLQKTVDDYYSTPPVFEENVIHPEDEKDID